MGENASELSFLRDIKSLFNEEDRSAMEDYFDLWAHDDVRGHAKRILEQVASGRMPCYGSWPAERVELFRRWVKAGMPP